MHLKTRNVNSVFRALISLIHYNNKVAGSEPRIVSRPSRNGNVLVIDEPVTITYTHPMERVLFNAVRDANPFFHLYEALWMLAGRNDVASLSYYCSRMKEFSDDGVTLNGAYGYRWRYHRPKVSLNDEGLTKHGKHTDQLDILVNHLKADPTSRRAVLSMWNVEDDLLKIGRSGSYPCCERVRRIEEIPGDATTLRGGECPKHGFTTVGDKGSKDVCCNLNVMFSLRNNVPQDGLNLYLDMTVTNRSNDLVWGLLGANYVHFTILQEYMAARLGVEVGVYHHFSNNLHVYDWNWKPEEWLLWGEDIPGSAVGGPVYVPTKNGIGIELVTLVKDPAVFEEELPNLVERFSGKEYRSWAAYREPFLQGVALPMLIAYQRYKTLRDPDGALEALRFCQADDWRIAATEWIKRRMK